MTEPGPSPPAPPAPEPDQGTEPGTLAARLAVKQHAGGIAVSIVTVIIAFLVGGVVVAATQHSVHKALLAYRDIFNGAGLNWIFHPTTTILDPTTHLTHIPSYNLSQTLLQTTTLILTGLAVAFAFRGGLFNIGGQGQYFVGIIVANWVGVSFATMSTAPHILLAVVAATLAGAAWAGIAGVLKATVGAHEVISTIMLNWIAFYVGYWIFGDGGPLQGSTPFVPVSSDVVKSAQLPVFWGAQGFQGLDIGIFIALGALATFWVLLNRTTLGYEVRAVGFNPDAAAYAGINVKKNIIRAMAISGAFAGLAGAVDMLGYLYHYAQGDFAFSTVGFLGIAVALLGRNTAVGVLLSAFLFGGLLFGSFHGLSTGSVISPTLAQNIPYIIMGLVVLFVGANVLVLSVWNAPRKLLRRRGKDATTAELPA
jgi:general nucleoside transport system permease protein